MTTRPARVARGTLVAAFAVFVAATSHLSAGGVAPELLSVTLSLAFTVPLCIVVVGKRLSSVRLILAVAASQLAFHALFSLDNGPMTMAGHAHSMLPGSPWMWLSHGCAAVVTIFALRYGEAALWRLIRTTAIRIVASAWHAPIMPSGEAAPVFQQVDVRPIILPDLQVVIGRMRHRGPPRPLAIS